MKQMYNALYKRMKELHIIDLAPVFDKGVRGRTLSGSSKAWLMEKVKEAGVKTVIDLRTADATEKFDKRVAYAGLEFHHIPMDSYNTPTKTIIDSLPKLFGLLDRGEFYIACAMGRHRTDIAIATYYVFHPTVPFENVPEMRGHRKDGKFRNDDIARRLNNIMRSLTSEDMMKLGLPVDYEEKFVRRKKHLFAVNSVFEFEE